MRDPVLQDTDVLEEGMRKGQKERCYLSPPLPTVLVHQIDLHLKDITFGQLLATSWVAWR